MSKPELCAFCDHPSLEWRIIRFGELITSFVSKPWLQEGHSVVIPNRHVTMLSELRPSESDQIMSELGRLSLKLDMGYGTEIIQKHQPAQGKNGSKVDHLHFHVLPRLHNNPTLLPVSGPNNVDELLSPLDEKVAEFAYRLK